ncbi:DUF2231 domain-containing protein [Paenibacillus sp. D51F]
MLTEIMNHLHPIIVHFPIALISIGLVYDLVTSVVHRSLPPRKGLWLWLAAAFGAWLSVATGPEEDARGNTSFLEIHSMLADITAWVVTLLVLGRIIMAFRGNRSLVKMTLAVYLVLSIASFGLVLGTGYYGGKMVYSNGVGVKVNGTAVNPPRADNH